MQIMALREQPVLKPVNFYGTPGGPLYYPLRPVVLLGTDDCMCFDFCLLSVRHFSGHDFSLTSHSSC